MSTTADDGRGNGSGWVAGQVAAARSMEGAYVHRWEAEEWPVIADDPEDGVRREAPPLPCLQLSYLVMRLDDGPPVRITTYQNDDIFGLAVARRDPPDLAVGPHEPVTSRTLDELPTGPITAVQVHLCDTTDDVAEIEVTVGSTTLVIVAGEVDLDQDDQLRWYWLDESVLVFTSTIDADAVQWVTPRQRHLAEPDPRATGAGDR